MPTFKKWSSRARDLSEHLTQIDRSYPLFNDSDGIEWRAVIRTRSRGDEIEICVKSEERGVLFGYDIVTAQVFERLAMVRLFLDRYVEGSIDELPAKMPWESE
jgi:hypothetical protein